MANNGTTGHETEAVNVEDLKATLQKFKTEKVDPKADKTATVSDVTYDSLTGKLKKTINGTSTNVCDVVTSGFRMEYNPTTGIKSLTPVGGATGAFDNSTGIKSITF